MTDELREVHRDDQASVRVGEVMSVASDVATYHQTLKDGGIPEELAADLVREFQSAWLCRQGIVPEPTLMTVMMGGDE